MDAAVGLLLVLVCAAASEVEPVFSNGWRPISRDRVYNYRSVVTPRLHPAVGNGLEVVEPPQANLMATTKTPSYIDQGVSIVLPINRRVYDSFTSTIIENQHAPQRRGKNIEFVPNIITSNISEDKHEVAVNKINREVNSYEVVESTKEEAVSEATSGDNYDVQENKKGNNLTDNLLKILLNYNIRSDDVLPNYALSLKQQGRESDVYMRVPYNSANHAPVDPLLAVFLSHYGHYVPGFYGFQRNYRNLYGYAASNNIHNNKPFGSYKIFADTDSSL